MIKSLIMAFSTYSRVPMPKVKWDEKYMKYIMCFFPFIGVFIGGVEFAVIYFIKMYFGNISILALAAIMTVLPILITGGIHMDGYMDTVDAKSSYKPKEEKLKILKDPHAGAFAIIYGIVYFLLYFAFAYELIKGDIIVKQYASYAVGFVFSRILSGLSVLTFPKAKKDGMLASAKEMSDNKSKPVLFVELFVCVIAFLCIDIVMGAAVVAVGFIVLAYYYVMSQKTFGGVTGDLAGYFLQLCELGVIIVTSLIM